MTTEPVTVAEMTAACEAWRQMYQAESQLTASLQADCASMSVRVAVLLAENESLRLEVNKLHTECGHLQADLREALAEVARLGMCNEMISTSHAEIINHQNAEITQLKAELARLSRDRKENAAHAAGHVGRAGEPCPAAGETPATREPAPPRAADERD